MIKEKEFLKPIFDSKKILEKIYKKKLNLNFKTKKDFQIDPVTKIDLKSEEIIRFCINKYFPNHSIIGEEKKNKIAKSEYTWIIDPIDGTKSMIMGLPTWSNLISLYKNNKCLLSFANFPKLNKYYIAYKKKCLVFENKKYRKIRANKKVKVKNLKLVINTMHSLRTKKVFDYLLKYKGFFKITGVDAYNFCSIAEGKFDVLIESGLKIVDILPLKLIIENSGASICDWNGGNDFSKGKILVCPNKKIQKFYLKILN